ncbi:hypothetical protein [Legionella maceachernii]|uniref:HTH cro/C1-type domain-containing protein n=1 Tax=Legionella maceachernii TaxID=466 RepID=A0A0W0VUP9_9GAMM|nr:hypothetical protein [Legionella maceachernii]KTD23943.1 hypothetical protein Lmac_2816 [Legionella maceachernii]SKA18766.1 hypothetical protein SAMN02745128_02442 [Legionella maceachernii]SUP04487.1 Uncharacterised protein [Legionella maceachernii]
MGCIIEFSEPFIRFNFGENKHNQKIWIEALLRFKPISLDDLASVLEVPIQILSEVHEGKAFFSDDAAQRLGQFFLLVFSI